MATDDVEEVELIEPRRAVTEKGAVTEGEIQSMNSDIEPSKTYHVDRPASAAEAPTTTRSSYPAAR